MKIHFIAIGGSAMHNLAVALHKKGHLVTGSDDEIFEPSKSRLANYGLLPVSIGWNPEIISPSLDAVILGMHARPDNPELIRASQLGIRIFSYPEFLYEQTKEKIRVVIGGSHGKTTITSMVMHVLQENHIPFDFMVGSQLEGFETMVGLNQESRIAVFEGDEYLSSPIDRRPKFHLYRPHIGLLTGIAWDHINVFPTFENYLEQFYGFAGLIEKGGTLVYFKDDEHLKKIASSTHNLKIIPYTAHPASIDDNTTSLIADGREIGLKIFGEHNLQNISGAKAVCSELGLSDENFYRAIRSFKGASRRLEVLSENGQTTVFFDFAHSPSKLSATTKAVKQQFPGRKLVACIELHTFSSLKREFLPQYNGCMDYADHAFVYFNPHTLLHKKLEPITSEDVARSFQAKNLQVLTNSDELFRKLGEFDWSSGNLLLMSSGNFDGQDLAGFAKKITGNSVRFRHQEWYQNPGVNIN